VQPLGVDPSGEEDTVQIFAYMVWSLSESALMLKPCVSSLLPCNSSKLFKLALSRTTASNSKSQRDIL
jgi:hypothetical protein